MSDVSVVASIFLLFFFHIICCRYSLFTRFLFSEYRHMSEGNPHMDEHIRRIFHRTSGPKKLMCSKCNTYYKHKVHLFLHQKLECGKPTPKLGEAFYCPYCDYKSYQKGNLFSHINRRHIRKNSPDVFGSLFDEQRIMGWTGHSLRFWKLFVKFVKTKRTITSKRVKILVPANFANFWNRFCGAKYG